MKSARPSPARHSEPDASIGIQRDGEADGLGFRSFPEQMLEGAKTLAILNYSRSFETEADLGAAEL